MEMVTSRMTVEVFLTVLLALSFTSPVVSIESLPQLAADVGLLINFSIPCDLNSAIAIPDQGGLLTPVLLGVGEQTYKYDGASWVLSDQQAILYNKTLDNVGYLSANFPNTSDVGAVTFVLTSSPAYYNSAALGGPNATVTATLWVTVPQNFAIDLQLLNTTSDLSTANTSPYQYSDYVQRFGTIDGLPPSTNGTAGDTFQSRFAAFYAFYLPLSTSPQLASRVPRCGDERYYGFQFGTFDFPCGEFNGPTPGGPPTCQLI